MGPVFMISPDIHTTKRQNGAKMQAFPSGLPFGHHYATCRSLARKIVERPLCLTWGNTSRGKWKLRVRLLAATLGTCLGKNMIRLLGSMPWTLPRGPPTFLEEEVFMVNKPGVQKGPIPCHCHVFATKKGQVFEDLATLMSS